MPGIVLEKLDFVFLHLSFLAVIIFLGWIFFRYHTKKRSQDLSLFEGQLETLKKCDQAYNETKFQLELQNKFLEDAIVLLNEKGLVYYLNQKASKIFGHAPDKIINQPLPEWVCHDGKSPLNTPGKLKPGSAYSYLVQNSTGGTIKLYKTKWNFYPASEGKEGAAVVFTDFTELLDLDKKYQQLLFEKNEINKQLNCLFDICDVCGVPNITFEGILERSILIIPNGMKFTHDVWVEISYRDKLVRSQNFSETPWSFTAPIKIRNKKLGYVKVGYITEKPGQSREAFHLNEKLLIKTIAEKLGQVIEFQILEKRLVAGAEKELALDISSEKTKKPPRKKKGTV
ncbi:MAG TPA: PAS domain-containing protein [Bacteroidales bacterium]|nr:PAS domain-containing protein [Bacteroidales bacterium]